MISTILDFILHIDVYLANIIAVYGNFVYPLIFSIIFLETGFVFTPFLPGDSLLFVSGTFASLGVLNLYLLLVFFSIAAILGDSVNYFVGRYFGERVFSKYIKSENLERTRLFFHNYGKKTILLARFVPIIRTFAPFVAGIGKMNYFTFLGYNIVGGILWVFVFVLSGFYFGNISVIKDNLAAVIVLIVFISFIPVLIEYIKHKRKNHSNRII